MKKTFKTAAQTAALMGMLTLISKLFGFVREMVMANFYGASYITDAYVMAITIPTIIFSGIWGSVAMAYMPIFSEVIEKEGNLKSNIFTNGVLNLLLIISVGSSLIGIVFSEQIVRIFASGFEGQTAQLTVFFVKITFSYVLFTSASSVLESYLQYKGIFLPQIIIGYLQNIIIIAIIITSVYTSHYILIFGWLIAYFVRLIIVGLLAKRNGHKYSFQWSINEKARKVITLALPVFIGSSMGQINLFVDKTLASKLIEGSVSALNYATLLIGLMTGLTITILTTIIYPKLSQANSLSDFTRFSSIISTGISLIFIIAVPFTLGAMIYNETIVQLVFERGAFDMSATKLTSSAFFYYSIGLLFISINTLLTQGYFSMQDMKTPMALSLFGVIINIVLNFILVKSMAHNGLALATSISYICNAILLYTAFKYKYPKITLVKSMKKIIHIIISALLSIGISYIFFKAGILFINDTYYQNIAVFVGAVLVASVIYLGMLILFKVNEVKFFKDIWKRKHYS